MLHTTIFGLGNMDAKLKEATRRLREYAKAHNFNLRLKKLTKSKLGWASKKYPELTLTRNIVVAMIRCSDIRTS